MDETKVAAVLRYFPELFNYIRFARADIIHRYRQTSFGTTRSSGPRDITGAKAIALIDLVDGAAVVAAVRRWIDDELPAGFRPLLLDVWRGLPWSAIAQKRGQEVGPCIQDFEYLIDLLTTYLIRSAGPASGRDGIAFALGRGGPQDP